MTVRWLAALVILGHAGAVHAQPSLVESSASTHTLPRGRLEVGVFRPLRYGLTDEVELATQPLMPFVPQVEGKVQWRAFGQVAVGSRMRLSYPTPLLNLVARDGALGLLPPTSDVPQAIVVDADGMLTWHLAAHTLTPWLGVSVAPRESADGMPLLDFPFLYARFAVLKTTAVYRIGLDHEAMLGTRFRLAADFKLFLLPVIDGGFSFEPGLSLRWLATRHFALEAGTRLEYAKYPAGRQFHYLPFIDALFAW